MALWRVFWEVFWQVFGIFYMAVGVLAILNGGRLYWLSRRSVAAEKTELQSLCKHWLWNGVSFFAMGFFVYIMASTTADLFSQPLVSFGVAVAVVYLMYRWFRKRLNPKKATNCED